MQLLQAALDQVCPKDMREAPTIRAVLVAEILGGSVAKTAAGRIVNVVHDRVMDLSKGEGGFELPGGGQIVEPSSLLTSGRIKASLDEIRTQLDELLDQPLSVDDIEHVVIRDPSYVAGSRQRPEVHVFAQTREDRKPLNDEKLAPMQVAWMKWAGGPIVARSRVLSWHTERFEGGHVNRARELAQGTKLFGLDAYWQMVQDKVAGWTTVVRLREESWLDTLIYPVARSRGSSWVYLDTLRKKIQWLSVGWESERERDAGRNMPAGLRFRVLRRDSYTCRYCGAQAPDVQLHVDHVVPWVEVREHEITNLVAACSACNLGKSDEPLPDAVVQRLLAENRAR